MYLIRPNLKVEGSYPFIIPVYDQVIIATIVFFFAKFKILNLFSQYNVTGEPEETNNVIIGYSLD